MNQDDSLVQSKENFEKFKIISEQNNLSIYHVTLMYASLFKLFRLAMRLSSLKQEVKFIVDYLNFSYLSFNWDYFMKKGKIHRF